MAEEHRGDGEFIDVEEEDEFDGEFIDEEEEEKNRRRMGDRRTKCDAIAWIIGKDGSFHLAQFKDIKERSYCVKLKIESVEALRLWCDMYLKENEVELAGYQ